MTIPRRVRCATESLGAAGTDFATHPWTPDLANPRSPRSPAASDVAPFTAVRSSDGRWCEVTSDECRRVGALGTEGPWSALVLQRRTVMIDDRSRRHAPREATPGTGSLPLRVGEFVSGAGHSRKFRVDRCVGATVSTGPRQRRRTRS